MEEKIRHLLASLVHPETGQDIVSSGFIEHIASAAGKITVVLRFAKARDPFAVKIKNQAEELLKREFPDQTVLVVIKEGGAAPRPEPKLKTTTGGIAKVIAVASGKGGVGKSTVTANLAVALRNRGFRSASSTPTSTALRSPRCSEWKATCPTPCRKRAQTTSSLPSRWISG